MIWNNIFRSSIALVVSAGLAAVTPGTAHAATAAAAAASATDTGLEEVVVTATRREERLQDVAISVTSFSPEKMDAQGVRNIDDLSRLAPGLTFQRTGVASSGNYNDESSDISIRGIDSGAGASTTALYVDDTPIQGHHIPFGAYNAFPQLFDLDRVEVLRGPQGTLFGAGAEGGAVRFLTPQPDLKQYSEYARSELATTKEGAPSYEIGGAVGGPIVEDVVGFRASASYRRDGGWVDRVAYTRPNPADPLSLPVFAGTTQGDSNSQETVTARAALKWQVNQAVSVSPSIYYQRLQMADTSGYWIPLSDPAGGIYRNGNFLKNTSTDPFWLAAVKLDWDLGSAKLVSNTSYFSRKQESVSDLTQLTTALYAFFGLLPPNVYSPPGTSSASPFSDTQKNFYQEVRLASSDAKARVTWTVGAYYAHTDENVYQIEVDPTLDQRVLDFAGFHLCSPAPCAGDIVYNAPVDRVVEKQLAVFGEVGFKISDTLKATLGLRYSRLDSASTIITAAGTGSPDFITSYSTVSDNPVTPKVALAWQPDRDNLYYVSAAKGFRQGGANGDLPSTCASDLALVGLPVPPHTNVVAAPPYTSDSLWSYEIGAKNTLFDRRLQINSSVFFVNWKDIQQGVYLPNCAATFVANAGAARSKGGEVEMIIHPVHALSLGMTLAYVDASYTRGSCVGDLTFNGTGCTGPGLTTPASPVVSSGDHLVGAPWTVILSAEYAANLLMLGGRSGYVRMDYQSTSAQTDLLPTQNANNAVHDTTIPGLPQTKNLNLRFGTRFGGLDLSLFANNLTNEHPLLYESRDVTSDSLDNLYFGHSVRPRMIGLTATYRH